MTVHAIYQPQDGPQLIDMQLIQPKAELQLPLLEGGYSFFYLSAGQLKMELNRRQTTLTAGQALLLRPDQILISAEGEAAEGYLFSFSPAFFEQRYHNNILKAFAFVQKGLLALVDLPQDAESKLNVLLACMYNDYQQEPQQLAVLRSYANIIFFELQERFAPEKMARNIQLARPNRQEEKMLEFEQLVEEHFQSSRAPSFYAQKLFISTNYLNKLCKRVFGKTSGAVIRKRVQLEAERLLCHSNLTIAEISQQLGFETPSYFITFFRKSQDCSPEQYRQSLQQELVSA